MIPVILSGGVGSRLWPLSRGMYPKQLLCLHDENKSMLQETAERVGAICDLSSLTVVCNNKHRFMVAEQLSVMEGCSPSIILESVGRNTAPAIALAAFHILETMGDQTMLVMPADHVIADLDCFHKSVELASTQADLDRMVTFGINPLKPETGYGYIKRGTELEQGAYQIDEFKEKPELEVAKQYLESKDYFWNSGIFVFRASTYLEELKLHALDIYDACEASFEASVKDLDFIRADSQLFSNSLSDSIDYAVMERTQKAVVVPMNPQWSDVGSWSALWEIAEKDADQNAVHGDVIIRNTSGSYLYSTGKLIATLGLENVVVVDTDDVILVAQKDKVGDIKGLVKELTADQHPHTQHHRKVYRPWGWYDSIDVGANFQVKRIGVKPGARLSIQMHRHRAEHWVVVKGVAEVLNGKETFTLNENQSTYIPIGVTHSLKNPSSSEVLEIIEIQSGSYLGEDDIVRFEDIYGRA